MVMEMAIKEIAAKSLENAKLSEIAKGMPDLKINVADLDKSIVKEVKANEINEYVGGGSYRDVKDSVNNNGLANREVHHMPADSVSELLRMEGPAIEMDKVDHRFTASCGRGKEAEAYRAQQKELIDNGRFREAMQMDIDDIHNQFGDKYDKQIEQMVKYVDELEEKGAI